MFPRGWSREPATQAGLRGAAAGRGRAARAASRRLHDRAARAALARAAAGLERALAGCGRRGAGAGARRAAAASRPSVSLRPPGGAGGGARRCSSHGTARACCSSSKRRSPSCRRRGALRTLGAGGWKPLSGRRAGWSRVVGLVKVGQDGNEGKPVRSEDAAVAARRARLRGKRSSSRRPVSRRRGSCRWRGRSRIGGRATGGPDRDRPRFRRSASGGRPRRLRGTALRLLVDTHVFLWWRGDDARLGRRSSARRSATDRTKCS